MLLGKIVDHAGFISLQVENHPNCYYPLGGNSGVAVKYQETFNQPAKHDVGRELHLVRGELYLGDKPCETTKG